MEPDTNDEDYAYAQRVAADPKADAGRKAKAQEYIQRHQAAKGGTPEETSSSQAAPSAPKTLDEQLAELEGHGVPKGFVTEPSFGEQAKAFVKDPARSLGRAAFGAINTATFGLPSLIAEDYFPGFTEQLENDPANNPTPGLTSKAEFGGALASGLAGGGLGTGLAKSVLSKVAPKFAGTGLGAVAADTAGGALASGVEGTVRRGVQDALHPANPHPETPPWGGPREEGRERSLTLGGVAQDVGTGAGLSALGSGLGQGAGAFRESRLERNPDLANAERSGAVQTTFGSGVKSGPGVAAAEREALELQRTGALPAMKTNPEQLAAQKLAPKVVQGFQQRGEKLTRQLEDTKGRFRQMQPGATVSARPFLEELEKRAQANVMADTRQVPGSGDVPPRTADNAQTQFKPPNRELPVYGQYSKAAVEAAQEAGTRKTAAGGISQEAPTNVAVPPNRENLLPFQGNDELYEAMRRLLRVEPLKGNEAALVQGTKIRLPPAIAKKLGVGEGVVPANMTVDEVDTLVQTMSELAKTNQARPGQAALDYKALDVAARKVRDQIAGGEYSKEMNKWHEAQEAYERDVGHALSNLQLREGGKMPAWDEMTAAEQKTVLAAIANFGKPGSLPASNLALTRAAQESGALGDLETVLGAPATREVREAAAPGHALRTVFSPSGGLGVYSGGSGLGGFLGVRTDPLVRSLQKYGGFAGAGAGAALAGQAPKSYEEEKKREIAKLLGLE